MPSSGSYIIIRGARTHNLKSIDVDIPKGKLTVICGPSGSGKTSLAFNTLFVEGQRRYIESLSARIRQHFEDLPRADVDYVGNLSPTVAVGNEALLRTVKGDVAHLTEIYDFLRLLFTHLGEIYCPSCNLPVREWDADSIVGILTRQWLQGRRAMVAFAPPEGTFEECGSSSLRTILEILQKEGWARVLLYGRALSLDESLIRLEVESGIPPGAHKGERMHSEIVEKTLTVIVDRVQLGSCPERRLRESVETALARGGGRCLIFVEHRETLNWDGTQPNISEKLLNGECAVLADDVLWQRCEIDGRWWLRAELGVLPVCPGCGTVYTKPQPNLFSSHTALGACPRCQGRGKISVLEPALLLPDLNLTLEKGAVAPFRAKGLARFHRELIAGARAVGIPTDQPVATLSPDQLGILVFGEKEVGFLGVKGIFEKLEKQRHGVGLRMWLRKWQVETVCPECRGACLSRQALAVVLTSKGLERASADIGVARLPEQMSPGTTNTSQKLNIREVCGLTVEAAIDFLNHVVPTHPVTSQVEYCLQAVLNRLNSLRELGLGHLNLDRSAGSLSFGEFRRTLLAGALGSGLKHVIYVLDEPTVGLHPCDRETLRRKIQQLRDRGNTVVVIEHDEGIIRDADFLVEIGPGAGERGGQIVFQGPPSDLVKQPTLTGEYLRNRRPTTLSRPRRQPQGWIRLAGACGHNLKHITVEFPLGVFCVVTGVSGAGKSSLVEKTLYPALLQKLGTPRAAPLPFTELLGEKQIGEVILVDHATPSKMSRSNPMTFLKVFDEIRRVFAQTSDAKIRGYHAGHFSFNSREGQCPRCQGSGALEIDMVFLPSMEVPCPECEGTRYRSEILTVSYRGKNIAEILQMTVREAYFFFRGESRIQARLRRLMDVGLEYLRLGQPLGTLSGGESQRLKLAAHFSRSRKRPTLFILNEPTAGLHPHDIAQLLECFETLLSVGHSLLVIEHNLHLVAAADYVIDLGPGAGIHGGQIVAQGTPEEIAACPDSVTGQFLRKILRESRPPSNRPRAR